jgi:hypothetical protein
MSKSSYRPEEVANELGVSGKLVRAFLRRTFPRPVEAKNSAWVLSNDQRNAVIEHFAAKNPEGPQPELG